MARKRILVVEDSMTARMLVQLLLESERYDVVTAFDRADALAKAKVSTPDLILMDVQVPLNGAATEAERESQKRVIQIISVTAHGECSGELVAFECDCMGFATKPVDPVELLTKVRRCLGE